MTTDARSARGCRVRSSGSRARSARLPRQIERAAHQVLQLLLGKRLQLEHRVVPQLDRTAAGRGIALRLELEDGLTGAVLVQCGLAADLGAEGFGLHRAVRVRVDRVRAQGHVDGVRSSAIASG